MTRIWRRRDVRIRRGKMQDEKGTVSMCNVNFIFFVLFTAKATSRARIDKRAWWVRATTPQEEEEEKEEFASLHRFFSAFSRRRRLLDIAREVVAARGCCVVGATASSSRVLQSSRKKKAAVPGNFLSVPPRNVVNWMLTALGATSQGTSLIPPRERPSVSIE